jgi:hypothetical protein
MNCVLGVCVHVCLFSGQRSDWELWGMSRRDMLNYVIRKAQQYSMLVMLDFHRLNDQFIPQLWWVVTWARRGIRCPGKHSHRHVALCA